MQEIPGKFGKVIICECLAALRALPDKAIDLCITDPPYNVEFKGLKGGSKDGTVHYVDDKTDDEYREFCIAWWKEVKRVCHRAIFTCGYQNFAMWMTIDHFDYMVWKKPFDIASNKAAEIRHFEPILTWGDWSRGKYKSGVVEANSGLGWLRDYDTLPNAIHPCPKPIALWRQLILPINAESVLDIFGGTAISGEVCEDGGIPWTCFEINPEYIPDMHIRLAAGQAERKRKQNSKLDAFIKPKDVAITSTKTTLNVQKPNASTTIVTLTTKKR